MLVIAWQYLTGRCVATDFTDREKAEWPPHPDRVFQALVAAWGERGADPAERNALLWLEKLGTPKLVCPPLEDEERRPVKVYVPVNDIESSQKIYGEKLISLLPEQRDPKARYFPSVRVGDGICALVWEQADTAEHAEALTRLCAAVGRIGHSSSLVRCWHSEELPSPVTHVPVRDDMRRNDFMLRVFESGRLHLLAAHHQAIVEGQSADVLPPRARQFGYIRARSGQEAVPQGDFSAPLLVFRRVSGTRFHLRQTLDATQTLRRALIAKANDDGELCQLISGHGADGQPLQDVPHVAYVPLAFAGHRHADGHLLGLAMAMPSGIFTELEDRFYAAVAALIADESERTQNPDNENFKLYLGTKGELLLSPQSGLNTLTNLRSETWCRPATLWASMTPIVMDRMQNARRSDPDGWAAEQINIMCRRQGLPEPIDIQIRPVSFLIGAPTVREFWPLQRKSGAHRRMVHALLEFPAKISGPLILGAGRFKGYGFCKPLRDGEH